MAVPLETKPDVIRQARRHEADTGSAEVQISVLTARIQRFAEHFRTHAKDMHGRRGLVMMVGKRNRLLRYLARTDHDSYKALIGRLGLRK
jgi:small subunit ribosomal protein S15